MPYTELTITTNFTFLKGASHAETIFERAGELGYTCLGIADEATMAGMVRAHLAAKKRNIKLLVGARFRLNTLSRPGITDSEDEPDAPTPSAFPELILYATDRQAYGRLCRLITTARRRAPKGHYLVTLDDIAEFSDALIALALPPKQIKGKWPRETLPTLDALREIFAERIWLACTRHLGDRDAQWLAAQLRLAELSGIPPLACNDVLHARASDTRLADVLTCIREKTTLDQAGTLLASNGERYLKAEAQIQTLFKDHPELLAPTQTIADACTFSLDELRYEYPREICPPRTSLPKYLADLTWKGAAWRYPEGIPDHIAETLRKELALVSELNYESYFLTVFDIVRFARKQGILCQGRGSAANSAVCFCLGITSVDPKHHSLLLERFISRERSEPPDIDVDFEHERREEVLQYIYEKYGRERAGLTATVTHYRGRSTIRDVAKVLGLSRDQIDGLSKNVGIDLEPEVWRARVREAGIDPNDSRVRLLFAIVAKLSSFPRHLSQHVGGMVMTAGRLDEMVPVENAAMENRTVIEWDKDDIDALGILKVDCLSLGMLTAIRKCFSFIEKHQGKSYDLATALNTDPRLPQSKEEPGPVAGGVYDMICEADTVGVFQIESRAQMSMLPRLQPKCFYDLVIEVAIVRPGPIQGGMVHPYLKRRNGEEPITYPHPCTIPVLERTLGVPLFQEQAMGLVVEAAGYTPGQADLLRKSMAAWGKGGSIEQHKAPVIEGMMKRGIKPTYAEQVFKQIEGFSGYGFPESHSVSFALLAYVSCYLKRYYPAAFLAAMLNSQPLGFYSRASLIRDAREHGVEVLPADVSQSNWDSTLEGLQIGVADQAPHTWGRGGPKVRLGLRNVKSLSQDAAERIIAARAARPFSSVDDAKKRADLNKRESELLAQSDAFFSLEPDRRQALWQAKNPKESLPLFAGLEAQQAQAEFPPAHESFDVERDYQHLGYSLRAHPFSFLREQLVDDGAIPCASVREIATKERAKVAGLVLSRQRPGTASGVVFITLEDETGICNVVVWRAVYERFRRAVRTARTLVIEGTIDRDSTGKVVHLMAETITPFRNRAASYTSSRDFH